MFSTVAPRLIPKELFKLVRSNAQLYILPKPVQRYWVFLMSLINGKGLPRDRLEEIIDDVTSKHGIDAPYVSHSTLRSRENRSNNVIVSRMQGGHTSPIVKVDDKRVG